MDRIYFVTFSNTFLFDSSIRNFVRRLFIKIEFLDKIWTFGSVCSPRLRKGYSLRDFFVMMRIVIVLLVFASLAQ